MSRESIHWRYLGRTTAGRLSCAGASRYSQCVYACSCIYRRLVGRRSSKRGLSMADNFQNFELLSHRNLELGRAPRGIKVTQFQKDFDARPRDAKTQKSVAACGRAGRPPFPPFPARLGQTSRTHSAPGPVSGTAHFGVRPLAGS